MAILKRTPSANAVIYCTINSPPRFNKASLTVEEEFAREEEYIRNLLDLIDEFKAVAVVLRSNLSFKKAVHDANAALQVAIENSSINHERYSEIGASIVDCYGQRTPCRLEGSNMEVFSHDLSYDDYLDISSATADLNDRRASASNQGSQHDDTTTAVPAPPAKPVRDQQGPAASRSEAKSYAAATASQLLVDGPPPTVGKQTRPAKRRPKPTAEFVKHQEWAAGNIGNHIAVQPGGGVQFNLEKFRAAVDESAPPKFKPRPVSNVMHIVGLPSELSNKEMTGLVSELSGIVPLDITRPRRSGASPLDKPMGCYALFTSPERCSAAISTIRTIGSINGTKIHCGHAQPTRSPRWQRMQLRGARAAAAEFIANSILRIHPDSKGAYLVGDYCTHLADLDQLWRITDSRDWWSEQQVDNAISDFTRAELQIITADSAQRATTELHPDPSPPLTPRRQPSFKMAESGASIDTVLSQDPLFLNIAALHEQGPTAVQASPNSSGTPDQAQLTSSADTEILVADSPASPDHNQPATSGDGLQGDDSAPSSSAEYVSLADSADIVQYRLNVLGTPSDFSATTPSTAASSGNGTDSEPKPPSVSPPRRRPAITQASMVPTLVAALANTPIPQSPNGRRKQSDSSPVQLSAKKPRLSIPASPESSSSPPGSDDTPGAVKRL